MSKDDNYDWGIEGLLTYGKYLKVQKLIDLQDCLSDPPHHDELQFIIVHQVYELWFKLMLHEMDMIMECMQRDNIREAARLLYRVTQIQKLLIQQIHILETMKPVDFLKFRDRLNPASGFQSAQFRELEIVSGLRNEAILKFFEDENPFYDRLIARMDQPSIGDVFYELLKRNNFDVELSEEEKKLDSEQQQGKLKEKRNEALVEIYTNDKYYELHSLVEALIEYDECFGLWREHHVKMVERLIGGKQGTGGSEGVGYLKKTLDQKFFPEFWEVRTSFGIEY